MFKINNIGYFWGLKKVDILNSTLIILVIAMTLFFSRQIFYFRYDPEYFENYYYNSQWNVPQSSRGMSDGELYKFVGYRLVQGENPFNINFEAPPFAKHLYGIAEYFLGNPYWISLGFYFLTGLAIYLLSLELFKSRSAAIMGVLLLVTTPFITSQIRETMLDLPLTSLFLIHALFFIRFVKRLALKDLIIAGMFLGLATGTKIGVYTPLTLIFGMILIMLCSKNIRNILLYPVSVFAGYMISYSSYFIHHPNPLPWLRLHEKSLSFYFKGGLSSVDYLNQWRGIFLNSYQGFWVGAAKTGLGDWTIILPIGVVLTIYILYLGLKRRDYSWIYLAMFSIGVLTVNTFTSFWARYLMPVVPMFILFILYVFRKITPVVLLLALLNLTVLIPTMTANRLSGHAVAVERFLNTRAYRELYRSVDQETRHNYSEEKFQSIMEDFYVTMRVKKIEVSFTDIIDRNDLRFGKINTKYSTNFGEFSNTQEIKFVKEHNQWKTIWRWDYLWPGFDPKGKIEILAHPDKPQENTKKGVYVIPRLMYDWGKYTASLSILTKMSPYDIDKKIRETIPDDFARFVGYLNPGIDPDTLQKNTLPGIRINDELFFSSGSINFIDINGKSNLLLINNR